MLCTDDSNADKVFRSRLALPLITNAQTPLFRFVADLLLYNNVYNKFPQQIAATRLRITAAWISREVIFFQYTCDLNTEDHSTATTSTYIYTVSQKNDNNVAHYNFNAHQPISLIFGTYIAE